MQPPSDQNINNTFFKGMYKDVWKKLIPPPLTQAENDFIVDVAGLKEGDAVLDIMCGYGRHTIALAKKGIHVTAIDNLPEYIDELKQVATEDSLPVEAFASDILQSNLKGKYKAAICMGNSFAFFNKEDAVQLLKNISNSLEDEGVLIINSWMIAEIALKHFKEREWQNVDEYKYLLHYKYFFNPARIESEHTIIREDGKLEVINGVDYIFTLSELESMFLEAGLKTKHVFSTPRKKPFTLGDATVYIVAEKK